MPPRWRRNGDLLDQNTPLFQNEIATLSAYQMNFIRLLADGVSERFTSADILRRYNLGTSANVTRIKKALLEKELIEIEGQSITLSDPVFKQWFRSRMMR